MLNIKSNENEGIDVDFPEQRITNLKNKILENKIIKFFRTKNLPGLT